MPADKNVLLIGLEDEELKKLNEGLRDYATSTEPAANRSANAFDLSDRGTGRFFLRGEGYDPDMTQGIYTTYNKKLSNREIQFYLTDLLEAKLGSQTMSYGGAVLFVLNPNLDLEAQVNHFNAVFSSQLSKGKDLSGIEKYILLTEPVPLERKKELQAALEKMSIRVASDKVIQSSAEMRQIAVAEFAQKLCLLPPGELKRQNTVAQEKKAEVTSAQKEIQALKHHIEDKVIRELNRERGRLMIAFGKNGGKLISQLAQSGNHLSQAQWEWPTVKSLGIANEDVNRRLRAIEETINDLQAVLNKASALTEKEPALLKDDKFKKNLRTELEKAIKNHLPDYAPQSSSQSRVSDTVAGFWYSLKGETVLAVKDALQHVKEAEFFAEIKPSILFKKRILGG